MKATYFLTELPQGGEVVLMRSLIVMYSPLWSCSAQSVTKATATYTHTSNQSVKTNESLFDVKQTIIKALDYDFFFNIMIMMFCWNGK